MKLLKVMLSGLVLSASGVSAENYTWSTASSGNWSDTTKWTPAGAYPNAGADNAVLNTEGGAYTVALNVSPTMDTFTLDSASATFLNASRILYTTKAFFNAGAVQMSGGALHSDNMVIAPGMDFKVLGMVAFTERTTGDRSFLMQQGTLDIIGSEAHASLAVSDGFSNSGTILLTSEVAFRNAELSVTSGVFTNASGGELRVDFGLDGARALTASLVNEGVVNINADTLLSKPIGIYLNMAAFNIAPEKTVTLSGTSPRFVQAGGTLDNQGSFKSISERFDFTGGSISGNAIDIYAGILNIGSGSGSGAFKLDSNVNYSGNIHPAQQLTLLADTTHAYLNAANGFSNEGAITLTSTGGVLNATLAVTTGTFINRSAGILDIEVGSGGARYLSANLVNEGVVNMHADTLLDKAIGIYSNNAAFNIAPGKTVTLSGTSPRFVQAGGTLDNQGAFHSAAERFDFTGGNITGNDIEIDAGILNIGSGSGSGAFKLDSTVNFSGNVSAVQQLTVLADTTHAYLNAANGFSNDGLITLTSTGGVLSATLSVTTGTFVNRPDGILNIDAGSGGARYLSSNLENNGMININADTWLNKNSGIYSNNAAFNIAPEITVTLNGISPRFVQAGGTLDNQGAFESAAERFDFSGGNITGNAIEMNAGSLNIGDGAGSGAFTLLSTVAYSGNVSSSHQLTVEGRSGINHGTLSAASGFSNDGLITLTSTGGVLSATLSVTTGTFVNRPDGILDIEAGSGGARYLTSHLENNGTINVNADTVLSRNSGIYSNNAAFNIAPGINVTLSGISPRFVQAGGILDNQGVFESAAERFDFSGGNITGNAIKMNAGSLNIGDGAGSGAFTLLSTVAYSGNVSSNQQVTVEGRSGIYHGTLNAANGFSNDGLITLTSSGAVLNATLTVTSGVFTNAAGGVVNVEPGSGGVRYLNAVIRNAGELNLHTNLVLNRNNAAHVNTGTINLAAGTALQVIGTGAITLENAFGGLVTGNGSLDLTDPQASFFNAGTIAPGNSAGELTVLGDFTQTGAGQLQIEIGNAEPGTGYDQFIVAGDAYLDGTIDLIDITASTGYQISSGQTFTVISATSIVDNGIALTPQDAVEWALHVGPTSVVVEYLDVPPFQLIAAVQGKGAISPAGYLRFRDPTSYVFTNTPALYWHLSDVLFNGVSQGASPLISVDVSSNSTYTAFFEADTTARGTEHEWLASYGFTNDFEAVEAGDQDSDGYLTWEEFIADSNPTNTADFFRVAEMGGFPLAIKFHSALNRLYSLDYRTNLHVGAWQELPGRQDVPGEGGTQSLSDTNQADAVRFYQLKVRMAE